MNSPIETPTPEVKPKAKKQKAPEASIDTIELEHYEERLKVHRIPNKDLLENRFAYNPSILETGNTIYMAYRYAVPGHALYNTAIGLCELDKHWNVKPGSNRKLELIRRQVKSTTFDDPRLFTYLGKPYMTYINGMLMSSGKWASATFLVDLERAMNDRSYVGHLPRIGNNINASVVSPGKVECEKNWTPFELEGKMYFVYTINPLIVCEYDIASDQAHQVCETKFDQSFWKHGEFLAGGTPLTRIGNELVGFFHSFTNEDPENPTQRTYHVGFWAMSVKQPFKVTRMSKVPFMTAKKDEARELRHPNSPWLPNCIFPGGFVERDGKVFIAQGFQDCSCEIIETDWATIEKDVVTL